MTARKQVLRVVIRWSDGLYITERDFEIGARQEVNTWLNSERVFNSGAWPFKCADQFVANL